jgi:hypothetical protein
MREAQQEVEPVDGRLRDNQSNKSGLTRGGGTTRVTEMRGCEQTTGGSSTGVEDVANQEVLAKENKMWRCRLMGGDGLTRGLGGSGQEAAMQLEESGHCCGSNL